jgi:CheY-like chemotaxis protein
MTRVLVVDDVDQNRYLLRVLLEGNNYQVDCARDGAEALVMAETKVPDLLITDILMPVMDGFSLCRHWKHHERLKHVPLMFYTATYTDSNDEAYANSLGADAFVIKPADPVDLLNTIRNILRNRDNVAQPAPAPNEAVVLKQYNSVLIHKLEQKVDQLEAATLRARENEERLRWKHRRPVFGIGIYRRTVLPGVKGTRICSAWNCRNSTALMPPSAPACI